MGQLQLQGDGTTNASDLPVAVSGLSGAVAVSGGGSHSLALLGDGTVRAWGSNGSGQLGDGTITGPETCAEARPCSRTPVVVSGLSGVVAVSAGGSHSLALLSNGTVRAWGNNGSGQLGNGTTTTSDVPVVVSGLSAVVAVSAGGEHSLALLSNGTVTAWGGNRFGQLGDGGSGPEICGGLLEPCSKAPVAVSALSGVRAIGAGSDHSLALVENGTVTAWGLNQFGQLGNGTTVNSSVAIPVSELSGVSTISAGEYHSLAYSPPPPTVTAISPTEGAKAGGTSVSITGTALEGATEVRFGSAKARSFRVNSETSITAISPAGSGIVDVTVTTPVATSATSAADRFNYSRPTVRKLSPRRGPAAGGTSVTITGTNFVGVTGVKFGSTNATSFKVTSERSMTAISPARTARTAVHVTVTTPSGASAASRRDRFRYGR